jgi:hypothetical protein
VGIIFPHYEGRTPTHGVLALSNRGWPLLNFAMAGFELLERLTPQQQQQVQPKDDDKKE